MENERSIVAATAEPPQTTIIHGSTFNSAGRDIIYNIQNVQNIVENPEASPAQDSQQVAKTLDWLSPINFRDIHDVNYERYTPETVQWFLEGESFKAFLKGKGTTLCGTGMPGAGKTTLSAAAITVARDLMNSDDTSKMAVNYVFCRYTELLSLEQILSAMVRQLVEDHEGLFPAVERLFSHHLLRKTRPNRKELAKLLMEMAQQFEVYCCFLDGLDEALIDIQEPLLHIVKSLGGNLLLTTRPIGFLEDVVPDAAFFKVTAMAEDIERLVSSKIQENSRLHKLLTKHSIKEEVISKIRDTANGMFLHASLQIEMIRHCTNRKTIMEKLEGLPINLTEVYSHTLNRILSQPSELADLAKRVLCWVLYSKGPLTIEGMRHAVSSHAGNSPFDVDAIEDDETLISVCFGLVVAEDPGNIVSWEGGGVVNVKEVRVRLIHYTAQEALEPLLSSALGNPHALLAEACVNYLSGFASVARLDSELQDLQGLDALKHISTSYSFYRYAWLNLGHHCKEALRSSTSAIDAQSARRFIMSTCPYPLLQVIGDDDDYPFDVAMLPIHVAAWYNLLSLFEGLVDDNGAVVTSTLANDVMGVEDHFDFLGLLKDMGDKEDALRHFRGEWTINDRSAAGRTALMIAACSGFEDGMEWLLRFPNLDVNAKDRDGRTAFVWAAYGGHIKAMQRLLELPYTEVGSDDIAQALMLAREPEVGEFLMNLPGFDPNASDEDGRTAIMKAIPECKTRMISLLLSSPKVDLNAKDSHGRTALMHAVSLPEFDSAWILMNHSRIDINARDPEGRTALMLACLSINSTCDVTIIQDLLSVAGIDTMAKDNVGKTALCLLQQRIQEVEDSEAEGTLLEMKSLLIGTQSD